MSKKNALGRGLDALITIPSEDETNGSSSINEVELSKIVANPAQPRQDFDQEALQELATSIQTMGLIQPITLRELDNGTYQIIAGERRYRASILAGLNSVPAYIKRASDDEVMEMALVENIQRQDLNSIEIALAYQKMIDTLSLTQEQLSDRIGKKRATVTNYLRLLKLPAEVQLGVKDKKIDMGHARALISLANPVDQLAVYNEIVEKSLSVRDVEAAVRKRNESENEDKLSSKKKSAKPASSSDDFDLLASHLSEYFKSKVQLSCTKSGKGKITIPFESVEDLERIMVMLDSKN